MTTVYKHFIILSTSWNDLITVDGMLKLKKHQTESCQVKMDFYVYKNWTVK